MSDGKNSQSKVRRPKAETPKGFRDYFGAEVTERKAEVEALLERRGVRMKVVEKSAWYYEGADDDHLLERRPAPVWRRGRH